MSKNGIYSIGAVLRDAREAGGLSQGEVAARLKLSTEIIKSLEVDDYNESPSIYIKGYIRSYARLFDLDEEALVSAYNDSSPESYSPNVREPEKTPVSSSFSLPLYVIVAVISLIIVIAAFVFLPDDDGQSNEVTVSVDRVEQLVDDLSSEQDNISSDVKNSYDEEVIIDEDINAFIDDDELVEETTIENKDVIVKPIAVAQQPEQATISKALRVTFNQESWMRIQNNSSITLVEAMLSEGEVFSREFDAPITITLGNAPGVSIQWGGKNMDDVLNIQRDNTARIVLE